MKLILYEIRKSFFKPSFLLLLLFALAANGLLFWSQKDPMDIQPDSYRQAYLWMENQDPLTVSKELDEHLNALAENEGAELWFCQNSWQERLLVQQLKQQVDQISGYSEFLEEAVNPDSNAGISIFEQQREYDLKDQEETIRQFEKLIGVQPVLTASKSLNAVQEFSLTDFIAGLIILAFVLNLMFEEKENGLLHLFRSTKNGRFNLLAVRILLLAVNALILTITLWGSSLVLSQLKFGFLDLNAPIQSISGFYGCSLNTSVGGYLLIFAGLKMLAYFVLSLVFLLIAILSPWNAGVYVFGAFFILVEAALYALFQNQTGSGYLHYLNIIFWMQPAAMLRFSFNLNVFGTPVNVLWVSLISESAAAVILSAVSFGFFCSSRFSLYTRAVSAKWKKLPFEKTVSIPFHELYRLLVTNKGILVLAVMVLVQCWTYSQKTESLQIDQMYYQLYAQQYTGMVNDQTDQFISSESERFEKIQNSLIQAEEDFAAHQISKAQLNTIQISTSSQLQPLGGFELFKAQAEYAKENNVPVFVTMPAENLMGYGNSGFSQDLISALLMVCGLAVLLSEFLTQSKSTQMDRLIDTTAAGSRTVGRIQLRICLLMAAISFGISFFPELFRQIGEYRTSFLFVPLNAMAQKQFSIFGKWPVWLYLLLLNCIRLLMALAAASIIYWISRKTSSLISLLLISLLILAFPLLLQLLDIHFFDYLSFNPLLSGNMLLNLF